MTIRRKRFLRRKYFDFGRRWFRQAAGSRSRPTQTGFRSAARLCVRQSDIVRPRKVNLLEANLPR